MKINDTEMNNVEQARLFDQLLNAAKTNKKGLLKLKDAIVANQQYELAGKIRDIEKELFPPSDEEIQAKKLGEELNLLFRMVDLNIADDVCWIIFQAVQLHLKKKGKFSIQEASDLTVKRKRLFES